MKIVLIGYMGSGKSAVGRRLAQVLGFTFLDLDFEIERNENRLIADIFAARGEIYFRKREAELLRSVIASEENMVLATGGGTPCYGNNLDFLKDSKDVQTIYLNVSLDILTHRLFEERDFRPLISHLDNKEMLNDFIRKHLFERAAYYNLADEIVKVEDKSVEEVCEAIVARLF